MCGGGGGGILGGGGIGAVIGGIVGSIVPGIGTAVGAGVGGLLGSTVGGMINNDFAPAAVPKMNTNVELPADQGLAISNMSSGSTGAKVALGKVDAKSQRTGGSGAGTRTKSTMAGLGRGGLSI